MLVTQIYEIQTPEDGARCLELGVDRLGSVLLSAQNWRQPLLREVTGLTARGPARSSLIPLFRDLDTLCRALDYYRPHYVHFCDNLTDDQGQARDMGPFAELQLRIRQRYPGLGILRSIPVPPAGYDRPFPFLNLARELEPVSDLFLTDTWLGREPVAGFIGITGRTADWDLCRELVSRSRIPVILAGGLSPDNVHAALRHVSPAGADSCTLTNETDELGRTVRFRKDFRKVARFVDEVRRAGRDLRPAAAARD